MIGTFFNLCRACPSSMPLDKLHSEYKSTYRWHEFSAGPEVVRKPPMPNQFASSKDHFFSKSSEEQHSEVINTPINEPPLPRRKKCPELAYRHHEFIIDSNADRTDSSVARARSGDRNVTPSRRSKSEGPPLANGRCVNIVENATDAKEITEKAGESSGLLRKTISKLSTEYRLQFVWPSAVRKVKGPVLEPPRKSQSMGAIRSTQLNNLAGTHKKRTTNEKEAAVHELEPLVVQDAVDGVAATHEKKDMQNEYRKNFKSAFYSEKEKFGFEQSTSRIDNKFIANGHAYDPSWYKEVLELRKKAGEYRNRGWCGETSRDLYNKQKELWREVSRRSSLSALSLASSIKPITKEDKERENKIKSSPTKPSRRIPGGARLIDNRTEVDGNTFGRFKRDNIRHHLERTTGVDVEEGALLPSPTREKLMPTLPRSKTGSPQRGSPQKTFGGSRHGSPLKGSPQKSPKKISKVGRSQSVGPTVSDSSGSPKKQPKPMSASITASTASSAAKTHTKKTPASTPTVAADHHPRSTASQSSSNKKHLRSKSSTLPNSARQKPSTLPNHHSVYNNTINSSSSTQPQSSAKKTTQNNHNTVKPIAVDSKDTNLSSKKETSDSNRKIQANKIIENKNIQNKQIRLNMRPTSFNGQLITDNSMHGQRYSKKKALGFDDDNVDQIQQPETIIKSPPEPTRVKSPEQIVIMRSPDPVFWTVPLDTGKTFTVTQNVRAENEANIVRPHSEIKVTTPSEPPAKLLPQEHPQSQSAPPELWEQESGNSASQSPIKGLKTENATVSAAKPSTINGDELLKISQEKSSNFDRAIPGSTLRCLEDPGINSPPGVASTTSPRSVINPSTTEVVDKARDRFDKFWGGNEPK